MGTDEILKEEHERFEAFETARRERRYFGRLLADGMMSAEAHKIRIDEINMRVKSL